MPARPAGHRLGLVDARDRVEMVAEIAGCGEIRRPAVFVAAIAGDRRRRGEGLVEPRAVLGVEREAESREVVGAVLALAEPRADDGRGDRLVLEHPARRDIGDRDAMLSRDLARPRAGWPGTPPSRRRRR